MSTLSEDNLQTDEPLSTPQETESVESLRVEDEASDSSGFRHIQHPFPLASPPPKTDLRRRKRQPYERKWASEAMKKRQEDRRGRDWRIKAIEAVGKGPPTKKNAARAAGVSYTFLAKALEQDTEFREAFEMARRSAVDGAYEVAWKMGVTGVREPITYQGEIVGYVRKIDTNMTKFILQSEDPETFDPRVRASRIQAQALGNVAARREQMLDGFNERFAKFDAIRQRALAAGATADVIDVAEVSTGMHDDDDEED